MIDVRSRKQSLSPPDTEPFLSTRIKLWEIAKRVVIPFCRGPLGWAFLPRIGKLWHHPPMDLATPHPSCPIEVPAPLPRISIVTPSMNQSHFLELTIQSVIDQNYPDLEYIVQDGGSSDGTCEVLKNYERHLTHWESVPDNGQAHAINRGFRHATGEIMSFLNSDDLLLPGTLNYVADFFNRNPDVDVVYGHRILIDTEGKEIGRWILPPHDTKVIRWADYVPQETMFWRRRVWETVGGALDQGLRFAMDWDLILRFDEAGAMFARIPRFLGAFRIRPDQKTSSLMETWGNFEMNLLR